MVCLKRPKINYKKANNQYIMFVGFWYASRYDLLFWPVYATKDASGC